MKSIQKVTRVKLKINQNNDSILLGLVSAEPDYKLSLTLNKQFRISLKNILPVKLIDNDGSELVFSRFSDTSGSPDIIFSLIANRFGKHFLLRKLINIDYIFQIQDSDNGNNINHITAKLRETNTITAVFNIDMKTIKDKNLQYLTQ
ncbi:MAG: IPExxxVDY family protein [Bacteroidia bacterium]|nr:IPExxxVDY family protein [Bacteroidia bacterium]